MIPTVTAFGQSASHSPKTFVDSTGRYFQQASQPVYLFASSEPQGDPVLLKKYATPKPVYFEGHGVHTFKHVNHSTQQEDVFMVHADGRAPVTKLTAEVAPSYKSSNGLFYGKNLSFSLSSQDDMSGVDKIYHAEKGQAFTPHKPIAFSQEGIYEYHYYAVDRVGNCEEVNKLQFTVDLSVPHTFHTIVGISSQNVLSVNSSISLTGMDSLSGVAHTFYKFDRDVEYKIYKGANIPFKHLPDGDHTLYYYSKDHTDNEEPEKSITFYLDKTAPILSADVLGDKYLVEDKVYFSGRTKLKLTAVDNKSGLKDLMYAINGASYRAYDQPFYLPNKSGMHRVNYYAVDKTNNRGQDNFNHSVGLIYLDLTGPSLNTKFQGPMFTKGDTTYISAQTKIQLVAADPESGVKAINYTIDDQDEVPYAEPFTATAPGKHMLNYQADDNVNNRNAKTLLFVTDTNGPKITWQFGSAPDKEDLYPSYTTLFLAAVDAEVAIGNVYYSINGKQKQQYLAPITGLQKNKQYLIDITATDQLGNTTTEVLKFGTGKY